MNATAAQTFEVSAAGIADVSQQGKNRRHGFAGPRGRHAATNQPAREPAAEESAEIRADESAEIRADERNPRRHPDLRPIETVDALEVLRKPEEVKIYKKRWLLDSERFGALHPPIARPAMIAPPKKTASRASIRARNPPFRRRRSAPQVPSIIRTRRPLKIDSFTANSSAPPPCPSWTRSPGKSSFLAVNNNNNKSASNRDANSASAVHVR